MAWWSSTEIHPGRTLLAGEDLRRWFLQNEVELFKCRFVNNPPSDMNRWLQANGMKYESISGEEQRALKEELTQVLQAAFDEKGGKK